MNRPPNWYSMDAQERRTWEKQAREIEDLEYERDRERKDAEAAQSRARRQQAAISEELAWARDAEANLQDELDNARRELKLRNDWLREKGLYDEFDQWASMRRDG